ncbi:unnamed protein product [Alopecurus aequalis]
MATSKRAASRLTEIPDHLLAEILLRLPTAADLARASAASVSFRRLVTDRSFLRRFRRLHAPPLLGFLDRDGFHPAQPPHPSAPGARALALAADFSFSFLPSRRRWTVQDIRDGRVLLVARRRRTGEAKRRHPVFRELAVCDTVHQRYTLLPSVPDALAASLETPASPVGRPWCDPFLAPIADESDDTFRVICVAHCETGLAAFVFSSSTGQWQAAASKSWSDLLLGRGEPASMSPMDRKFFKRHYAYGCFYWDSSMIDGKEVLVLDTRTMEFSITDLPPGEWKRLGLALVGAGEGRLGMFGFRTDNEWDLIYTIMRNKREDPSQWQTEKIVSLDSGYIYSIRDATETHLLLIRVKYPSQEDPLFEYFSVDIKTLQLQRVCSKQRRPKLAGIGTLIYTNFPPSLLSSRAI